MQITRDGKTYTLTPSEVALAWEEHQLQMWRSGIEDAIERNADSLRFGENFTMDEFIEECMSSFDLDGDFYAEQEKYDEVVFDTAESNDVWKDTDEDDDDEECDC